MSYHFMNFIPILNSVDDLHQIKKQIEQYGFFYFHVPNDEIINDTYKSTINFFSCDDEFKNQFLMNKNGIGYIPKNRYHKKHNLVELKEQISFRPNEIYINDLLNQKLNHYYEYMSVLASNIFIKILESYQIDKSSYTKSFNTLTLLHYKKIDQSNGEIGIREHTDWGYITILWTDSDGLQIKINDEWIDIPTKKNCYIVNIGDSLEKMTDGKIKSTTHRVKYKNEKYSIAYFYEPSIDTKISKKVTFGDYLNSKLIESYNETFDQTSI